jgi:uncharacterized protein YkwD
MRIRFLFLVMIMVFELNATVATKSEVAKLYVATFDRAPDSAGLDYWVSSSKLSLEGIAESFFDQPETKAIYGEVSDKSSFIIAVYSNLFSRAPDDAGFDYWLAELSSGTIAVSTFILATVNGAKDDDKSILDNKTEVGLAFADKGLSDVTDATTIMSGIDGTTQSKIDALNKFGLGEEDTKPQTSSYVGSQENTIFTNATTKLMWQNALLGHEELAEATVLCSDLSFGGYSDWRLPTADESKDFHYNMNAQGDTPVQRFSTCTAEVVSDGYVRTKLGAEEYGDEAGDIIGFKGKANVRCVRVDDGSKPSTEDSSLTPDIQTVVDRHNAIRAEVFSGSTMSWSETIASSAQAYADILGAKGVMEHDASNDKYGENLAIASYKISYTDATNMWYAEKPFYHYDENSCDTGEVCGHYTQIIWKDSIELGCGSAIIKTGRFENGVVVVCRYSPSGNWIGDRPY